MAGFEVPDKMPDSLLYKQAGNSVTVDLFKKIIGDIEWAVKDLKIEFEKGLRKQQNKNVISQNDEYEL